MTTENNTTKLSVVDFDDLYFSLAAYKSLLAVLPSDSAISDLLLSLERSLEKAIDGLFEKSVS